MTLTTLSIRSLLHHWRTNLAVCLGVAASVAVLGGALLVGDSVKGSLRDLALSRLGSTAYAISSAGYVPDALAEAVVKNGAPSAAPLIAATGFVTHEPSGRRASGVLVYGVDERFWRFHGVEARDGVLVSPAIASELGVSEGDVLLTRLQRPSEIPLESLFAHKEDVARTSRLTAAGTLPREQLGEFSLQPQQAEVRAVFAPIGRLRRDLDVAGQVNTILIGGNATDDRVERAFRASVTLADLGVTVGVVGDPEMVAIESAGGVIAEPLERAVREAAEAERAAAVIPIFTYLANSIRVRDRAIPYSLVTGIDLNALTRSGSGNPGAAPAVQHGADAIVLNEWTAKELDARPGDAAELEYYLWDPAAGLRTSKATLRVSAVVPMSGLAGDRRLAPEYPGITEAESLVDWDPPFPLDLSRVRPQDEKYWDDYRTTPKAFVAYERARDLWSTRYGRLTSIRLAPVAGQSAQALAETIGSRLNASLDPATQGLVLVPSRRLALQGSVGATNFGEYFTYFSFFIVVSALMLAMLFFRLGVEQRLRQIGVLRAAGYTAARIRRLLLIEAAIVAILGSAIGVIGAIGYAHVIVYGLKTWWVGAVGTTLLDLHVTPISLAAGAAGGVLAAIACVLWSLRAVARRTPRALLGAYSLEEPVTVDPRRAARAAKYASIFAVLGLALLTLAFVAPAAQVGAFFGAGAALLTAFLLFLSSWLRRRDARAIVGHGTWAVSRLGFRSAAFRPGRSVLCAALVASAAFIIVSVDAFRRGGGGLTHDPRSGTGGFALLAQSDVALVHNPNDAAGRDAIPLRAPELAKASFARFRMRPGEDASCLNLYRPGNPTLIAPEPSFVESNRFNFSSSLAENDQERANPWLLLSKPSPDGTVPAIADATSLQYVLHLSVGDTMSIDIGAASPLVLRFVGVLADSVLQGQIVIGEQQFVRLFPDQEGFRFFLVDAPEVTTREQASSLAAIVEKELQPYGVDAVVTADRLDAFHRVENTYLSTFQALGGLGLLLGTVGLATVMFRNVMERRRELALLRAVGFDARHVTVMILAETAFVLVSGLAAGAACAAIAIAPAWLDRGGSAPGIGLWLLLLAVVVAGILSSIAATRLAVSGQILGALRSE